MIPSRPGWKGCTMRIRCRSEIAALALIVLAACKPGDGADAPLPPVGEARMEIEAAACKKRGGDWIETEGARLCAMRTRDTGKACRTSDDCVGACLARSMTCAPVKPLVGCNEIITSGGLRVTECVQ